jgi:hypothetical protein
MSKERIESLRHALGRLKSAERELQDDRNEESARLRSEAHKKIEFYLDQKYGAKLDAAATARQAAQDVYDTAREELGATGVGAKYPIGTILVEWVERYGSDKLRATGRRAVVEVFTRKSEYLGDRPYIDPGDIVARYLKKDGTPGKAIHPIGSYKLYGWFPEGEDPNATEKKAAKHK